MPTYGLLNGFHGFKVKETYYFGLNKIGVAFRFEQLQYKVMECYDGVRKLSYQ